MRLRVGGLVREGDAVDLRDAAVDVESAVVARAVRGGTGGNVAGDATDSREGAGGRDDRDETAVGTDGTPVVVDCPDPGPLHDHVGHVSPDCSLDLRGALAALARARGHEAPEREALTDARRTLSALDPPPVDLDAARRRVADAGEDEAALRERVAALRGRVQALREADDDGAAVADLEAAVRRLSEAETERLAARQRLDRARETAREARDVRTRRLELEDRVANLERAARASLAAAVYDDFAAAVDAVPGPGEAGAAPGAYTGDAVTAALAVVRLAPLSAPVVLSVGRFPDAAVAADVLSAPVVVV